MRTTLIFFFSFLMMMCQSHEKKNSHKDSANAPLKTGSLIISGSDSMYSDKFIGNLKELSNTMSIELKNGYLTLDNKDKFPFPSEFHLNERMKFSRDLNNDTYTLFVKRISYTDIEYWIRFTNNRENKIMYNEGIAVLNAGFFLASGTTEDERSGLSYGVNEYSNDEVTIYVGKNEHGTLLTGFHLYNGSLDVESPPMTGYY